MKIGIKFCGGCNPVFDRGRRVERFKRENPENEYISDTSEVCDVWLVVCGCSRRCAGVEGLRAAKKIAVVSDEPGFQALEKELKVMEKDEADNPSGKRILHLHDRDVYSRTITRSDVQEFARLTGDENSIHLSDEAAMRLGYPRAVVHGMFLDSLVSTVMGTRFPGSGTVYTEHSTRFIRPVYQGDRIEITVEFSACEEREDCYIGEFRASMRNQDGERVLTAWCSQKMDKNIFTVAEE